MKKFIIIVRVVFVLAGLALILLPRDWWPDYFKPLPMGVVAIVYSFIPQVPVWILKSLRANQVLFQFRTALAVGMILNGIGSLGAWGWYQYGFHYDKMVHFAFPALLTYYGSKLWAEYYSSPLKKSALAVAGIIAVLSVAWEFIEYFSAQYFHLGFFGKLFDRDFNMDIVVNLIGIIFALFLLRIYRD